MYELISQGAYEGVGMSFFIKINDIFFAGLNKYMMYVRPFLCSGLGFDGC